MDNLGLAVGAVIAFAIAVVLGRRLRARRLVVARQRAIDGFDARRSELAQQFLVAAAATGKPRGLRWKSVDLTGRPVFAVDDGSGDLIALNAATIGFEAVEGGGMEDVEAVSNLRTATAVFVARKDDWTTEGRVIFNLEPAEAMERFQSALSPVAT